MTNQLGNKVGGDNAGRDVIKTENHFHHGRTPMTSLIEQYKSEVDSDKKMSALIEKLEHFFSNTATADIRGLEEKLLASGRNDLLQEALARKQAANKLIMRNQGSKSAQMIFSYVLAEIIVNFEQAVRPLIQNGADRAKVDKAILDNVIAPAHLALEENPLMLDKLDIQSLMYFLGGNCHIRWDSC